MKPIYLLLLILSLFAVKSYAQNAQEEKRWLEILQTAYPDSIGVLLGELEPDKSQIPKNDTTLAISDAMKVVLLAYKDDRLSGVSRYKDLTQWPRRIVVQPEVEICFITTPDIDYRSVFERKYFVCKGLSEFDAWDSARITGSRLDRYIPYYNDIPNLEKCKKYRYFWPDNFFIALDTLAQMRLESFFQENIDQLDSKKIHATILAGFGRFSKGANKGKTFADFHYNLWIHKIIFNPALDQCIVQMATTQSSYELYLLKVSKKWIIAHNASWIHLD